MPNSPGKGRGPGSRATQFKRVLESRPVRYYLRGPNKGKPVICKLCANFVRVDSGKRRFCPDHLREWRNPRRSRYTRRKREASQRYWLGIDRDPKPLNTYKPLAQRKGYKGMFMHLPESAQSIARDELQQMLQRHPDVPAGTPRYAAMVASATVMASYGGRKEWAKVMRNHRLQKGYARAQLQTASASL